MKKKKLRIAMVIDTYDWYSGGVFSTKRFVDALRAQGHKVILITTGKKEKDKLVLQRFYPLFGKSLMKKMRFCFAKPEENKIKSVLQNVDIVHVQLPFYLGIKTISIARELSLPVVTSFHVQAENITKILGINFQRIINLIYKFFVNKFYNKSDLVICPSSFAEKELKRYKLKSKSTIISNGYPEQYYHKHFKRKITNKFVILCVGRLSKEKHQDKIITAISNSKYAKDTQLIIVGYGPLKKELKILGKRLPVKPIFLENISEDKKIMLYNTSDLFIHYGEVELEGMSVLEATACGLPPLIFNSNKSASPQFALNKLHLFDSVQNLSKKIDYWYEHPNKLLNVKEQYLQSSKKYIIKESVKKLEKTYAKTITLHKARESKTDNQENNGKSWLSFLNIFSRLISRNK